MRFGICTSVENSALMKSQGWDFVEENCQNILQGLVSDDEWLGAERAAGSELPILAANVLFPASIKLVGPTVDLNAIAAYIGRVIERAAQVGIQTIVFGS